MHPHKPVYMFATRAFAGLYPCCMIDILIGQLPKSMTASLMLHQPACIIRIVIFTLRAKSYGSTATLSACPHLRKTIINGGVRCEHASQCINIRLCNRGMVDCIVEGCVKIGGDTTR